MNLDTYAMAAMTVDAGSLPSCFADTRRSRTAACARPGPRLNRSAPPVRCQSHLVPAPSGRVVFYAGEEVGDRRHRAGCVPHMRPAQLRPGLPAVLRCCTRPDCLLRNSKIICLAGRAMVSDRGPLACCATGRAAFSENGPVMPLTCGIVLGRIEETCPGMLLPNASTRTPSVRI